MYVPEWQTVDALTRGLFWCLFPELRGNEWNKHQNNTRVSVLTVCHERSRHNERIYDDKNDDLNTPSPWLTCSVYVLLITSHSSADDVTMTGQLWLDHVQRDI